MLTPKAVLKHTVPNRLPALLAYTIQMKKSEACLWHVLGVQHSLLIKFVWRNTIVNWHRNILDLYIRESVTERSYPVGKTKGISLAWAQRTPFSNRATSPKQTGKHIVRFLKGSSLLMPTPCPSSSPGGEKQNLRGPQESSSLLPQLVSLLCFASLLENVSPYWDKVISGELTAWLWQTISCLWARYDGAPMSFNSNILWLYGFVSSG